MKTDLDRYIENMIEINREALLSKSTDAAGLEQMSMFAIQTAELFREKMRDKDRELFVDECTKVMRKAGTNCPDNHEYFGVLFDSGRFKLVKDGE